MSLRVVVTALLLVGCDQTTRVEGTVQLVGMSVREGIVVRSNDGRCESVTTADGAFEMECRRGTIAVAVLLADVPHYPFEETVSVSDTDSVSVGTWTLTPKPASDGLWQLTDQGTVELTRTHLVRTGDQGAKSYCLPADTTVDGLSPSTEHVYLIDQHAPDWKVFRLDDDGCAQRWRWHAGEWRVTASDTPDNSIQQLPNASLHHFTLTPGRYFVADWADGRMTPDRAHATATGDKRYLGALMVVAE